MQNSLILTLALCILLPVSAVAQEDAESPSLQKLHQAMAELGVHRYPKSTSYVFQQTIGF